jgi:hypothetical protein
MFGATVDLVRVLVAAVASFVLGFLWHGPLFGTMWIRLNKIPQKELIEAKKKGMSGMSKPMVLNFLGNIVMAYVLASFIDLLGIATFSGALALGFWCFLGLIGTTTLLSSVLWDKKSWGLFSYSGAYWLVNLCLVSAIIAP